jgi:hypothetical protein
MLAVVMLIRWKSVLNFVVKAKYMVSLVTLRSSQFQNCLHKACFENDFENKYCLT